MTDNTVTGQTEETPIPRRCTPECWTPVRCPECSRNLLPRGRSAPLELYEGACCEKYRNDIKVNPRHLWDATDEERWRFYPDEAPRGDV